jgi:hypothetical protein
MLATFTNVIWVESDKVSVVLPFATDVVEAA